MVDANVNKRGEIAQTLDRGLQALDALSSKREGMAVLDVAAALGVPRSIAARLLSTLLYRGYVSRRRDGRYVLGTRLLTLARHVSNDLVTVATPPMSEVSERLALTVMLHVADDEEAVALASIEPRDRAFHVGIRPGTRHALNVGASGLAILAGRDPVEGERPEVTLGRERGYVATTSEVVPNFTGVDAPLRIDGTAYASVGLIVPADAQHDEEELGREVIRLAERITESLWID